MNEGPNYTMVEFVDCLLDIVSKFEEMLVSAKAFVEMNNDMIADGGDPFEPSQLSGGIVDVSDAKCVVDDVFPEEKEEASPVVRTHGGRRVRVTKEIRERIVDALLNRVPKPRMVDIAEEFDVSQTTVSRVWSAFCAENPSSNVRVDRRVRSNSKLKIDGSTESRFVPLTGQHELPIISEGRKPGPED